MKKFSFLDRSKTIEKISQEEYDIAIIGGGITGAGLARDAASRGLKVALVEAGDFASGTSSRSSKLIHGGIRYLENLEFHLVFEALSERALLFKIAPHMVHPLRFLLPLFKESRVGMFKMGMGMWLYDALSLFRAPKLHERLTPKKSLERISILQSKDLMGSYVYSDAYMDDDRLVIETLRSANSFGADIVSYVKVLGSKLKNEKIYALECEDRFSNKKFVLKAKHFMSATGPWTDFLGQAFFQKSWKPILRPSKGIHLTLAKKSLPLPCAVVMATEDEKRIVFAIPRHEMIIIGTTDTDFKEDPGQVHSTEEDVDYLLKVTKRYFPGANIQKEDIISSYAGVRPLVNDGSSTESKTSREHTIICDDRNVTFVAGGKYTTYRKMSEEALDKALKKFFTSQERSQFKSCQTKKPINPKITQESFLKSYDLASEITNKTNFSKEQAQVLIDRHGPEAVDIVNEFYRPDQDSPWEMEAFFAIENGMCGNLLDFYLRRSPLFLSEKDHGLSLIDKISKIFGQKLGWTEEERLVQIEAISNHVKFELSWKVRP